MFRNAIGVAGSVYEPIKHLRRGPEIQIVSPEVPLSRATAASSAISCTDLFEVTSYSTGLDRSSSAKYVCHPFAALRSHHVFRRQKISWDVVSSSSLVEVEIYIRATQSPDQVNHRIHYELCSVCVVDDTALRL